MGNETAVEKLQRDAFETTALKHQINLSAPLDIARLLVLAKYTHDRCQTLHFWAGEFFEWRGGCYVAVARDAVRAAIYEFLAERRDLDGAPIKPHRRAVDDVLDALRAVTILDLAHAPSWLRDDPPAPALEFIACANGLLHVSTRELRPADPRFFVLNAVAFPFDASAPAPDNWLRFLDQIFENDDESIECLGEWFGLLITLITYFQKALLLVGPPRSGKGTIARIIRAMIGTGSCASPALSALGDSFGLAGLIGRSVAIMSDVRLSGRTDLATIAETILRVTGEDAVSVPRKFLPDWIGQLSTRFVLLSNELPALADASGALTSRFVLLQTRRSYFGAEDTQLTSKLLGELPGIFNWALAGLDRLLERGHFSQPESSTQALQQLEMLASPIKAFVADCCITSAGAEILCSDLFAAWVSWSDAQHRDRAGSQQTFGRNLAAAVPAIKTVQRRDQAGARHRWYVGVKLKDHNNA